MDSESMRARVRDAYPHGPEAVATLLSAVVAHVESLTARITALEGENATLRTRGSARNRPTNWPYPASTA